MKNVDVTRYGPSVATFCVSSEFLTLRYFFPAVKIAMTPGWMVPRLNLAIKFWSLPKRFVISEANKNRDYYKKSV